MRKNKKSDIFFEAHNQLNLIYLFLAAEQVETSLEDYLILLKFANNIENQPHFEKLKEEKKMINGQPALIYSYSADVDFSELGKSNMTYMLAILRGPTWTYRLVIYTLSEAYDRKTDLIETILAGFEILSPQSS